MDHGRDAINEEALLFPDAFQVGEITHSLPAEREVMTDDNSTGSNTAEDDIIDKFIRVHVCKFTGERDNHKKIQTTIPDRIDLFFEGEEELRGIPLDDGGRVGIEGVGNGYAVDMCGMDFCPAENLLMPSMATIEIADGDHRVGQPCSLYAIISPNYFHP
jgi:hypothetical protein